MRALTELGAVYGGPAATIDSCVPRRMSGGAASSAGRSSATHGSPSENSSPGTASPRSAAGSSTVESARAPLAASFNRPRTWRPPRSKKHPQALDFGVEVFAPPGTPPPIALNGTSEQPGQPQTAEHRAQPENTAAAELAPSSAAVAETGGHHVLSSPAALPESLKCQAVLVEIIGAPPPPPAVTESDESAELRHPLASSWSNVAAEAAQAADETPSSVTHHSREPSPDMPSTAHSPATADAVDAHPEPAPQTSADNVMDDATGECAAGSGFLEHCSVDGIAVRMRPSTAELDLRLLAGYAGCEASALATCKLDIGTCTITRASVASANRLP